MCNHAAQCYGMGNRAGGNGSPLPRPPTQPQVARGVMEESAMQTILLIGTAKGLFVFQSEDRASWRRRGPEFAETPVYSAVLDERSGTMYAGVNSEFYGASIRRSKDLGQTWDTGGEGLEYSAQDPEKVRRVWSIVPSGAKEPNVVYAGVEASGLFRSNDGGDTWSEVGALREHPTHELWGPGAGGKCLHTIAVDPADSSRLYIACSAGGFYRSDDQGASWTPRNVGLEAEFMPEDQRFPVAGQCVHKFSLSPTRPGRIWLQNHGGVYRSDDAGETWIDVGAGLPADFGFPVVANPRNEDAAFVIPLQGGDHRWAPGARLAVYATEDAGETWQARSEGLPAEAYTSALRDAFRADGADPLGLYLGTTSGSLFASRDAGAHWTEIAHHLPRIHSVTAWSLPA